MPPSSPTARARRLGRALREIRERFGLSTQQVADRTGMSQSKVSRIETARTRPSGGDVGQLLDLYGVDSATRASLIQLNHEAQQRGWWIEFGDVFAGSFVGFEDEALQIRAFETVPIPGLLQTPRYARAVIEAGRPDDPAGVDRRVRARLARQALLTRPGAPLVLAILDEAALRRPVGGREVMREQLRALLPSSDRPNVTVRVVPFAAGAHGGLDGPFTILSFDGDDPEIAYVESPAGDAYMESAEQTRAVNLRFERIEESALPVDESAELIAALTEE